MATRKATAQIHNKHISTKWGIGIITVIALVLSLFVFSQYNLEQNLFSNAANDTTVKGKIYSIFPNHCVTAPKNSNSGDKVTIQQCKDGDTGQVWERSKGVTDRLYKNNGLCLATDNMATASGTTVEVKNCGTNNNPAERWAEIDENGNNNNGGVFKLHGLNEWLTAVGFSVKDGNTLMIKSKANTNGTPLFKSQEWHFLQLTPPNPPGGNGGGGGGSGGGNGGGNSPGPNGPSNPTIFDSLKKLCQSNISSSSLKIDCNDVYGYIDYCFNQYSGCVAECKKNATCSNYYKTYIGCHAAGQVVNAQGTGCMVPQKSCTNQGEVVNQEGQCKPYLPCNHGISVDKSTVCVCDSNYPKLDPNTGSCVKIAVKCGTNQHEVNGVCVCNSGYAPTGNSNGNGACVLKTGSGCPAGEHESSGVCVCNSGYVPSGNGTCVYRTGCPAGEHESGGVCVCNSGYVPAGNGTCVYRTGCPAGEHESGGVCVCNAGYVPAGNGTCVYRTGCPAGEHESGGVCVCNSGYHLSGGACVPANCTYQNGILKCP